MSSRTEQQLRDLFDLDAAQAPPAQGLAVGARHRARRHRQVRLAQVAGVGLVVLLAAGTLTSTRGWLPPVGTAPQAAAPTASTGLTPAPLASSAGQVGPLPDGNAAKCAVAYSPSAVSGQAFAFDGTVTSVGPARSNRAGGELDLTGVTFRVNQWFRGGATDMVTVDLTPPDVLSAEEAIGKGGQTYEVGTRLLVSGEPRWGGMPLDNALASGCGFTRYYSPSEAAQWAASSTVGQTLKPPG